MRDALSTLSRQHCTLVRLVIMVIHDDDYDDAVTHLTNIFVLDLKDSSISEL